jgi:hypothetical protein
MRFRWRAILPTCGLLLFAIGTYVSVQINREFHNDNGRYFWWSALRLDSDPLSRHSSARTSISCTESPENCEFAEPLAIWIDPGWLSNCFVFSALPAWLAAKGIVRGLGQLGVSEITSFFVAMPLLTLAWFYFAGWIFDRWQSKRARA